MTADEISTEELLTGLYDEGTVLPVLKERGITQLPKTWEQQVKEYDAQWLKTHPKYKLVNESWLKE